MHEASCLPQQGGNYYGRIMLESDCSLESTYSQAVISLLGTVQADGVNFSTTILVSLILKGTVRRQCTLLCFHGCSVRISALLHWWASTKLVGSWSCLLLMLQHPLVLLNLSLSWFYFLLSVHLLTKEAMRRGTTRRSLPQGNALIYSVTECQSVADLCRPQTKPDVIPFQVFPSFTFMLVCRLKLPFHSLHLEWFTIFYFIFFLFSYCGIMKLWLPLFFFSLFSFHDQKVQELYDLAIWPILTVILERTLGFEEDPPPSFGCLNS